MDITVFLAQIWGPVIIAVGIGVYTSRSYYLKIYHELENEAFAVLIFGMVALAAGIVHIQVHNLWDTLPQIVVSLLGWGLLLKGIVCTSFPRIADRAGDWWVSTKLIPVAGGFMFFLGAYLSWFGYFA